MLILIGLPGPAAVQPVVKLSKLALLDTLVTFPTIPKLPLVTFSNAVILFHGVTGDHAVSHVSLVFKNVPMDGLVITKQLLLKDGHVMPVMDFTPIGPHGMAVHKLAWAVSRSESELIHVVLEMLVVSPTH